MVWRPIRVTHSDGREVMVSIFDRELYYSGFWSFEDLWEMYGEGR